MRAMSRACAPPAWRESLLAGRCTMVVFGCRRCCMIAIVDYKAGNLTSVKRALDHLGIEGCVTADPDVVRRAERIIFPGVGHAGSAMAELNERGLAQALRAALAQGTPLLGTCVRAQRPLSQSE